MTPPDPTVIVGRRGPPHEGDPHTMQDGHLRRPGSWADRGRLRRAVACVAGLGALALPPMAHAEPQTIACPLRVVTQAALLAEADKIGDFKIAFHGNSLAFLTGVAVFDGPPASGAEMPPAPAGNGMLQWVFPGAKAPPVLMCRYEGGVSLTRTLAPGMRACVASMQRSTARDALGHGLEFAVFACQ